MRVLIVVTHLLGTGHLSRALILARAFEEAGHAVQVLSGGFPAPHLNMQDTPLRQLPTLRSDGLDFTRLLTPDGKAADADYLSARQKKLVEWSRAFKPDVLITELFPFGRRNLRAEFTALLDAMPDVLKLASIRDILAPPSKPAKADFAETMVLKHYAGVLVHSDPELAPLELSWPVSEALMSRLQYTGFVARPPMKAAVERKGILVSTGGGAVGDSVFEAAIGAAKAVELPWTMVVGGSDERIRSYAQAAPENMRVTGLSTSFRTMLAQAEASASLVGYNTAMDLLQSGTPGVLVPFDAGNEVEQSIRAEALRALPGFEVLPEGQLTAKTLTKALRSVLTSGPRPARHENMDGASQTVLLCERLLEESR